MKLHCIVLIIVHIISLNSMNLQREWLSCLHFSRVLNYLEEVEWVSFEEDVCCCRSVAKLALLLELFDLTIDLLVVLSLLNAWAVKFFADYEEQMVEMARHLCYLSQINPNEHDVDCFAPK